jgi:membrane protease YdiL (CAAX protease family)
MKNAETHPLWISAVSYASYHVVVLAAIGIQPELICLCFATLVLAGRIFSWMHHTTGLWSAVLAHAGADVVIVGALFDWSVSISYV